jgi:hemerythrin-like domain-containing protein
MMLFRQVPRALDDEHRASLALFERLDRALARRDASAAEITELAAPLARHLEHEVGRHFDFEEQQLFTRLGEAGDSGIVMVLSEEHDAIRAVAEELLPMARAAAAGSSIDLPAFKRLAFELVERQVSHIQKETMALLPMLDDLLDEDTDRELALAYAAQ